MWKFTEKGGARETVKDYLCATVRSHYDDPARIAQDISALGYALAAEILRERLPTSKTARSGDLGEILASELVEEELGFEIPVRRLRYKDGREVALRGDDFIGVKYVRTEGLRLLKGESKSKAILGKTTITNAREALDRYHGRCTPSSLLFVADRLLAEDGRKGDIGRAIRKEIATKTLGAAHIDHVLFTMSGNPPPLALAENLEAADAERNQTVINIRIEDHQAFIAEIYEGAEDLGDD